MKKIFFLVFALLFVCGSVFAANIPTGVAPDSYPEIWTEEVFNDSGSALTSGSVVVWDRTDTDMSLIANRKMYVTTTTTVDDIAVAGVVVDNSIANQDVGTIAIRGPVRARVTGTVTAGLALSTSATAGVVGPYSNTSADDAALGFSIAASTAGEAEGGTDIAVVFVEPSIQAD